MTYTIVDYLTKRETDFRSLEDAQRALQRIAADYRRFGSHVRELVAAGYITVDGTLITIVIHHTDTLDHLLCVEDACRAREHDTQQ